MFTDYQGRVSTAHNMFKEYQGRVHNSVADPDPGSGIGFFLISDLGSRILDLGSRIPDPNPIFF